MIRRLFFWVLTFAVGWFVQGIFLYLFPLALPLPHWLLLIVLALGGNGRPLSAQLLGFFWGLALDVYGQTAFGAQGWALALCGFLSGWIAREVNTQKWVAQETIAVVGTLIYWVVVQSLSSWFVPTAPTAPLSWGVALVLLLFNALAAPAVFRGVDLWLMFEPRSGEALTRG